MRRHLIGVGIWRCAIRSTVHRSRGEGSPLPWPQGFNPSSTYKFIRLPSSTQVDSELPRHRKSSALPITTACQATRKAFKKSSSPGDLIPSRPRPNHGEAWRQQLQCKPSCCRTSIKLGFCLVKTTLQRSPSSSRKYAGAGPCCFRCLKERASTAKSEATARKAWPQQFLAAQQNPDSSSPPLILQTRQILAQTSATTPNKSAYTKVLTLLKSQGIKSINLLSMQIGKADSSAIGSCLSPSSSHPSVVDPPVTDSPLALYLRCVSSIGRPPLFAASPLTATLSSPAPSPTH